jgi:hypothetical protein
MITTLRSNGVPLIIADSNHVFQLGYADPYDMFYAINDSLFVVSMFSFVDMQLFLYGEVKYARRESFIDAQFRQFILILLQEYL